jgi:integrase
MAWVDEACGGFFEKEQAGTLKRTDVYVFRVAAMLDDFAVHGSVLRRYSRSVSKLSAEQADVLAGFQAWLRAGGCAVSTVRAYGTVAGEFLAFTASRGGLAGLDGGVIGAFVQTLAGYAPKTVEHKLCAVRSLLRFVAADGLSGPGVLDTVPAARSTRQARVPSVWDPADVARIIEAIDRGNPSGKRDYAIVLLICRLGVRGVDVKRLRFADLDWPGNRLSVMQAKTGRRVWLPLLKDVGWAVIDYVRDGRPRSDCPQVFLRHTAPIGPFSDQDHLHQIVVKHARVAHVSLSEKRRHGMHSLRHTLATRLMEDGTPVEQIADILGHQSVQSTGVYLKSSLGCWPGARWIRTGQRERGWRDERRDHADQRDHGAGHRETCARLQVRERGASAGAGSARSAPASSPGSRRSRGRRSRRGSPAPGGGR